MPRDWVMEMSVKQLLRSASSVGANIEEADGTDSAKDRIYKWALSRKEARETRFWIRLICETATDSPEGKALIQECTELINILSTLIKKSKTSLTSG